MKDFMDSMQLTSTEMEGLAEALKSRDKLLEEVKDKPYVSTGCLCGHFDVCSHGENFDFKRRIRDLEEELADLRSRMPKEHK